MLNILVVDDSLIIRRTLSTLLEKMGYTVVGQAKIGQEAVTSGAKGYILKPLNEDKVKDAIEKVFLF